MPEIQFFQTRMGQRFYESTMPELVRQLTRLNDLLERIACRLDISMGSGGPTPPKTRA